MRRLAKLALFALIVGITLETDAVAQEGRGFRGRGAGEGEERRDDGERRGDRDRDDDRGRDGERGRGSWGSGRGWGGGPPEEFWKRFDRNDDGMIAPDEVDDRFRDRLGIDKPIKVEDLANRVRRSREERDREGDRDNSSRSPAPPAVAGFGVAVKEKATAPGFGPPESTDTTTTVAASTNTSESRPSASTSGGGGGAVTSNIYVDGVFAKHDADKNGVLEGEELSSARGLPPNADGDNNGKLTRDELTAAVPSKSPSGNDSSKDGQTGARRSYRFASAHERLPDAAKSWIVSRDKNGDGQVAMHEFSRTWSDSKVHEFQRYDLNGDGVITAAEYVKK